MTVLFVHPHPDDEAFLTGGLILRSRARGERVVLITATRGERGRSVGGGEPLAERRTRELRAACEILGVTRQVQLDFPDSGVDPAEARLPGRFASLPIARVAAPIAEVLRDERPEVVVTATPDGTYGHPDHVRVHDATLAALDRLAAEDGWRPDRLAMVAFPGWGAEAAAHVLLATGVRPPRHLLARARAAVLPGTAVELLTLGADLARKRLAILAHASQVRGLQRAIVDLGTPCRVVFGVERYLVAGGRLGTIVGKLVTTAGAEARVCG